MAASNVTAAASLRSLREEVATANRIAHAAGLVTAFGHVSARIRGTDTFVIPTRASPFFANADHLLVMSCEGDVLEGDGQPNSESWIHARLYAARPDVGGVAHVHSLACVALSQLGLTVRPLHNSGAVAGDVPVFERAGLIRSRALGDAAARALGSGRALLLRGHGANIAGSDVRRAIVVACFLEEAARLQLDALAAAGGDESRLRYFDAEEAARAREEIESTGPIDRAWAYYAALTRVSPPGQGGGYGKEA
ncbi:MAG TPA: class II aldolase/adducin family protein [Candidatus Dormibacteraeota bacterium]|nr:class II aldolase/adducin family protein [Candidatus Dormibacteraeota bacterium]